MKRLIGILPLLFLTVWITVEGCRTVATPTFPTPPTSTITNTPNVPTNTATKSPTNSPTNTPLNTATVTPTNTPTNTPIPGAPTNTPTNSPTNSPTSTITNTPAGATSTPTYCTAASIQLTYTFETGMDCVHSDASNTIVTNVGLSTTQKHSGASSYALSINNTTGASSNAQFEITYSTPQNFSGATVVLYIYLDPGLSGASGFQVADQNPGCSWDSTWVNAPTTGSWIPVTFNPSTASCTGASTPVSVTQLVFQLTGLPTGKSGNLYIDDITITLPAGPTPTYTSTATPAVGSSFYFDSGSIPAGWSVIPTGAVTTSLLTLEAPGFGGSAGCMGVSVTWSASGQTVNFQYGYSSPTNWTALGITGIRAMVMQNPQMDTGGGCQLYCQSGSTYAWENNTWTNEPPASTWAQLNWVPPFSAGGSSPVSIQQFGIQFASGGTASAFAPNNTLFVDSVELY